MNFDDAESEPLKEWMIKKLSDISDADPDVLADYVLALVKSDEPEAEVRKSCQESLDDFLEGNTKSFINDVFRAIKNKDHLPPHLRPQKQAPPVRTAPGSVSTNGKALGSNGGLLRGATTSSLGKRSRQDTLNQEADYTHPGRHSKVMRGGRGRGGGSHRSAMHGGAAASEPQSGLAPFQIDWNDPSQVTMFQTMSAMLGFQMPTATGHSLGHNPSAQPCRDFYEKGACYAGALCPYDHGTNALVPGGFSSPSQTFKHSTRASGRGTRGATRGDRGNRGQRSGFSQNGPSTDKRNTSIVVEQIPQDCLSEEAVREFFSAFGAIRTITIHPEKVLAIVEYEDWASGKAAYDSPKVIFDNRFVKVYWQRPEAVEAKSRSGGLAQEEDAEPFDLDQFNRLQAEAQRKHEERMLKVEEARIAREALDAKIQAHADALQELKKKIPVDQSLPRPADDVNIETDSLDPAPKDPQTMALQEQLKRLEAEAQTLGLANVPDDDMSISAQGSYYDQPYTPHVWPPRARGRGRGRVFTPRGAYRGRGGRAGYAGHAGGSVARLDNRPRNVEVVTTDTSIDLRDDEHSEALRTMLFGIGDFLSISAHPDAPQQQNRAVIAFRERYVAEAFIGAVSGASFEIPGIGKCELAWVANDKIKQPDVAAVTADLGTANSKGADAGSDSEPESDNDDQDEETGEETAVTNGTGHREEEEQHENPDHDVADDDDDRWMR